MSKWILDNSIDDLMISEVFDDDEIVIRDEETGKIVWEGKQCNRENENRII